MEIQYDPKNRGEFSVTEVNGAERREFTLYNDVVFKVCNNARTDFEIFLGVMRDEGMLSCPNESYKVHISSDGVEENHLLENKQPFERTLCPGDVVSVTQDKLDFIPMVLYFKTPK